MSLICKIVGDRREVTVDVLRIRIALYFYNATFSLLEMSLLEKPYLLSMNLTFTNYVAHLKSRNKLDLI